MNPFDVDVLRFFNQFARHSRLFDTLVYGLSGQTFWKGWLMVALFWWVWFKPTVDQTRNRQVVVATFASTILAVIAGRLLADYLPFRLRPLQSPELLFVLPYGVPGDSLRTWSSFPSDHAMVFFAMSTGLWYVSTSLGAAATAYVFFFIALPRIYLGFHYPTDIIGGALLGILFTYAANLERIRERLAAPALRWERIHPASFYTFFLLFSESLATLFNALRQLAISLYSLRL